MIDQMEQFCNYVWKMGVGDISGSIARRWYFWFAWLGRRCVNGLS